MGWPIYQMQSKNTGDQDAQITHLVWHQNKKDPERNEGYIK